jgi:tetratricopeptide (TPR) repeat protein
VQEGLAYQLRAASNYLEELHPQTKDVSHLREIARVAKRVLKTDSRDLLWAPLLAFAYWLENELRLDESLDVLETAFRLCEGCEIPEQVAGRLQQGRVLRVSGRFVEASAAYSAAGQMAGRLGDDRSLLVSRIGRAWITVKTGDLPSAEAELRDILKVAQRMRDTFVEARAYHDLADVIHLAGRTGEATSLAFKAFQLYEEPASRARAVGDMGVFLKDLGHYSAAREAFEVVLDGQPSADVRANAQLELLELSSMIQDRLGFKRWRKELEGQYETLPPDQQADYLTKLGVGLAAFGNARDGVAAISRAVHIAETYKLGQRIFEAERYLREIEEGDKARTEALSPIVEQTPSDPGVQQAIESLYAVRGTG